MNRQFDADGRLRSRRHSLVLDERVRLDSRVSNALLDEEEDAGDDEQHDEAARKVALCVRSLVGACLRCEYDKKEDPIDWRLQAKKNADA